MSEPIIMKSKLRDYLKIDIAGYTYIPCWCCVHKFGELYHGKPHKYCGKPETTQCPIAKRFLQIDRMINHD